MTVQDSNQFYIPGITSLSKIEREHIQRVHPSPKNWQEGVFVTGDISVPYFLSKSKREKAIVIGAAGLNTFHLVTPNEVEKLNDAGISILWVTLPLPQRGVNVNERAIEVVRSFLTSDKSPAHQLFIGSDCPRYLATHSTSGRIALQLLHEEGTGKKLSHIFEGAVYLSPYLDTANGSILFNPKKDFVFRTFAQAYPNFTPHESTLGRLYMRVMAKEENFRNAPLHGTSLTYGQILQLQKSSRHLIENFNAQAAAVIPSTFLIGDKDPFACPKTTIHFARLMKADVVVAHGAGHYPLKHSPQLLDNFIACIEKSVHDLAKKKEEAITYISDRDFFELHTRPAIEDPVAADALVSISRHGLRGALQSIAGRLNPPASVLQ